MPRLKKVPIKSKKVVETCTNETMLDEDEIQKIKLELENVRREKAKKMQKLKKLRRESGLKNEDSSSSDECLPNYSSDEDKENSNIPLTPTQQLANGMRKADYRFKFNLKQIEKKYKQRVDVPESKIEMDLSGNFYFPEDMNGRKQQVYLNKWHRQDEAFGKGLFSAPHNSLQLCDGNKHFFKKCEEIDKAFSYRLSEYDSLDEARSYESIKQEYRRSETSTNTSSSVDSCYQKKKLINKNSEVRFKYGAPKNNEKMEEYESDVFVSFENKPSIFEKKIIKSESKPKLSTGSTNSFIENKPTKSNDESADDEEEEEEYEKDDDDVDEDEEEEEEEINSDVDLEEMELKMKPNNKSVEVLKRSKDLLYIPLKLKVKMTEIQQVGETSPKNTFMKRELEEIEKNERNNEKCNEPNKREVFNTVKKENLTNNDEKTNEKLDFHDLLLETGNKIERSPNILNTKSIKKEFSEHTSDNAEVEKGRKSLDESCKTELESAENPNESLTKNGKRRSRQNDNVGPETKKNKLENQGEPENKDPEEKRARGRSRLSDKINNQKIRNKIMQNDFPTDSLETLKKYEEISRSSSMTVQYTASLVEGEKVKMKTENVPYKKSTETTNFWTSVGKNNLLKEYSEFVQLKTFFGIPLANLKEENENMITFWLKESTALSLQERDIFETDFRRYRSQHKKNEKDFKAGYDLKLL